MTKQVIVIGLGHFGMAMARALSDRGVEVLAVDSREDRVRIASGFVTEAVRFDATDAEALARTSPERREVCICAIGDEAREASIICTALLRQMGAKRVVARANDDLHERILKLVGAHTVVNPEKQFGESFASQVIHENVLREFSLGDGLVISEFEAPRFLIGKTLNVLQLPRRFGITVVAFRKGHRKVVLPSPHDIVDPDDTLMVVSREGAVARMMDRGGV
jgi:trk system potassium uptake protein